MWALSTLGFLVQLVPQKDCGTMVPEEQMCHFRAPFSIILENVLQFVPWISNATVPRI